MSDLPTPEELGDKLKAGEITAAQAVEIMSERAAKRLEGSMAPRRSRAGGTRKPTPRLPRRYAPLSSPWPFLLSHWPLSWSGWRGNGLSRRRSSRQTRR
jgi:hypothetical protein